MPGSTGLGPERAADAEALSLAADVAVAFEKALRARSQYPPGHPAIAQLEQRLLAALQHQFDARGELELQVSPFALLVDGTPAFETADRTARSWFYHAFLDGIFALRFLPGLEASELEKLLGALSQRMAEATGAEEDLVSLLWRLRLDHVLHAVGSGFLELLTTEDPEVARNRSGAAARIVADAQARLRVKGPSEENTRPQAAPARLSMSELEALEKTASFWAYEVSPAALTRLAAETEQADTELDTRYVEILCRVAQRSSDAERQRALDSATESLARQLSEGHFSSATRALDAVRACPDIEPGLLAQLLDRARQSLAPVLDRFAERTPEDEDDGRHAAELAALLGQFGAGMLGLVLERLRRAGEQHATWIDVARRLPATEETLEVLSTAVLDPDPTFARHALAVAERRRLLGLSVGALGHPAAEVRLDALRLCASQPMSLLVRPLLRLLDDPVPGIRARTRALLGGASPEDVPGLLPRLRALLGQASSDGWPEEELHEVFERFGRLGAESVVAELAAALQGEGPLARPRHRRADAIIGALVATRAPRAIDVLARQGRRRFFGRALSRACRQAAHDMMRAGSEGEP